MEVNGIKKWSFVLILFGMFFQNSYANSTAVRFEIRGNLTLEKVSQFQLFSEANGSLGAVEFRESSGSSSNAGKVVDKLSQIFQEKNIHTFARGRCASTCALAFLLGESRTLLADLVEENSKTSLMIHPFRAGNKREVDYGLTDRIFKKIVEKSDGKFPLSLLERIYDDALGNSGELYIFRRAIKTKKGSSAVIVCHGSKDLPLEAMELYDCEPILGVKPQDLGILVE
jgi:hypothetical protein